MGMDMTSTFRLIGGEVTFVKVDGTRPGDQIEVELKDVVFQTMDGAKSLTFSGLFSARISCESATSL